MRWWTALLAVVAVVGIFAGVRYPILGLAIVGTVIVVAALLATPRRVRPGVGFGGAIAAMILVPTNLTGLNYQSTLIPTIVASSIALIGLLLGGRAIRMPQSALAVILLVLSGVVGGLIMQTTEISPISWQIILIVLWFVGGNLARNEIRVATWIAFAAILLLSVFLLVENVVLDAPLFGWIANTQDNPLLLHLRAQGTLAHPLVAGFVVVVGLALALRLPMRTPVRMLTVIFLVTAELATGSSGSAMVSFLLVVYAAVTMTRRLTTRLLAVSSIVIGGALIVASSVQDVILSDLSVQQNTHRLDSLLSIPNLFFARGPLEALLGSGWSSTISLYHRRLFSDTQAFAIDNQYVSTLALAGIVGLVAFVAVIVAAFSRGRGPMLPLVTVLGMGLSFDFYVWPVGAAMFVLAYTVRRWGEPVTVEGLARRKRSTLLLPAHRPRTEAIPSR